MIKEWFDGQVRNHSPEPGVTSHKDGSWVDEWWGPGGRLVIASLPRPSPATAALGVDAIEILYRHNDTHVKNYLGEGDDYKFLPELMGEELWARYQELIHAKV